MLSSVGCSNLCSHWQYARFSFLYILSNTRYCLCYVRISYIVIFKFPFIQSFTFQKIFWNWNHKQVFSVYFLFLLTLYIGSYLHVKLMECKINLNYLNISWRTNFFSSLSTFKFYILIIELNSPICLLVVEIQGKWNRMALYIFFLVTFKVDLWYSKNIFKWTSHLCFPACLVFFLFHPFLFIPLYFLLLFGTSHLQSVLVTQSCLTFCDHMD